MAVFKEKINGKFTNRWIVKTYYTDWKGEKKQHKKVGFLTQKEAKEYEKNYSNKQVESDCLTYENFVSLYLEDMKPRLKPYSYYNKEKLLRYNIVPFFAKLQLKDITPHIVLKWQTEMIEKNYSQTYLKQVHSHLAASLNYAVKYYGLASNPCSVVGSMGSLKGGKCNFWTISQFKQFNSNVESITYKTLYNLMFYSGIRIGEALALTYKDFDFNKNTVSISKSLQSIDGVKVITDPKTRKSIREIDLPRFVMNLIKEYKFSLYNQAENELLFTMSKPSVRYNLDKYARLSNLPKIKVHDLRHSHASMLIELNYNPKVISERLGHEHVSITLDTYSHLYPNKQNEIALKLEEISQKII